MSYKFGKSSIVQLSTLHPDLQTILRVAIKQFDFSIIEGIRTKKRQQELFNSPKHLTELDGVTKKSKHQGEYFEGKLVSTAVDIIPYVQGLNVWEGRKGEKLFYYLAGTIMGVAEILYLQGAIRHKLKWGGNWDMDMDFYDSNFIDLPHFELVTVHELV